jgi:competence protein ComEC
MAIFGTACAARSTPPPPSGPGPKPIIAMAALDVDPSDVYVRIVDVGPGLCVVVRIPDGHTMVFDGGHWVGQQCIKAVRELVTAETIDLMVISHSDSDHLGDAADILKEKRVLQTVLAGEIRETATWKDFFAELVNEVATGGSVHNLQSVPLTPGSSRRLGEATVTFIAGWGHWTGQGPTESERRNAISVVVRLEYRGRSVLFTGDTVGKRLNDGDNACKDAEKVMVDRHKAGEVSLKSDVVVASHHGGNNGSATCFIQAIDPRFVVFSSGHDHQHPTDAAANRFIQHGVAPTRMFRTDFGDDESGTFEWKLGSVPGCQDPKGDDDVEIALRADGTVDVDYLRTPHGCDSRSTN